MYIVLSVAIALGILMVGNRWKFSSDTIKPSEGKMMRSTAHVFISREVFLTALFNDVRPPENIGRLLYKDSGTLSKDSLESILKWALETQLEPLAILIEADLATLNPTEENITNAARNLVFGGAQYTDNPTISDFLFQRGKSLIDIGMKQNPNNISLRNAWITYISEYENEPMKFLGVLRETLAMDSNNVETHFIHLNLLRRSGQWKKAIDKCEKLISLQPQNPIWLYQTSEIYGYMGDSLNAKTYLELAVRAQKKQKTN